MTGSLWPVVRREALLHTAEGTSRFLQPAQRQQTLGPAQLDLGQQLLRAAPRLLRPSNVLQADLQKGSQVYCFPERGLVESPQPLPCLAMGGMHG